MDNLDLITQWTRQRDSFLSGKNSDEIRKMAESLQTTSESMKFKLVKLQMSDFRCFPKVSIRFNENLTVFHGINGRGKSTILEAIASLLSWFITGFWSDDGAGQTLKTTDIRVRNKAQDEPDADGTETEGTFSCGNSKIAIKLAKSFRSVLTPKRSDVQGLRELGIMFRVLNATSRIDCPLILFFSAHRGASYAKSTKPGEIEKKARSVLSDAYGSVAYEDALKDNKDSRFFLAWLTANLKRSKEGSTDIAAQARKQLDAFFQALQSFWSEFETLQLDQSSGFDELQVVVKGQPVTVAQLSDGQRLTFFLFGEIVWRLTLLNPSRENPLDGNGIVLIDEIELHLHPQWQVQIIDNLRHAFPNLQFIVTTHSPQVLSCVFRESLINLPETPRPEEQLKSSRLQTRGLSSNDVLGMVMETPTPPMKIEEGKWFSRCRNAIADYRFSEAHELLTKIKKHFGENSNEARMLTGMLEVFKKRKREQERLV